jgi:RNA-binding protein
MPLTSKQNSYLRSKAHHLKPVVMLGSAGLTEGVMNEIENAVEHHELIKIKINTGDRDELKETAEQISKKTKSELVQIIGHTAIIYRKAKKPVIKLPSK